MTGMPSQTSVGTPTTEITEEEPWFRPSMRFVSPRAAPPPLLDLPHVCGTIDDERRTRQFLVHPSRRLPGLAFRYVVSAAG
jgi:hypothetical protein